ncbi:MAG: hypothetical protein OFPI_33550 [Osedax symbiont Rs2]|nr:MAG: hypothetical protein OFPI_33550 [Osedax symbiont Rs2]
MIIDGWGISLINLLCYCTDRFIQSHPISELQLIRCSDIG